VLHMGREGYATSPGTRRWSATDTAGYDLYVSASDGKVSHGPWFGAATVAPPVPGGHPVLE